MNLQDKNISENVSQPSANQSSKNTEGIGDHSGVVERCLRNFILGKRIGAGTFSKVCIAKHKLTNEQVAIKIIQKKKIQNEADKIRLNRQIKIMRKVRHPNIAQLYQIIETNKYIYLVMQYAARGELFDHIVSHQKLTQFEASKFLLQLTDAIEYLHQLGIAHRDLKPQNLLLDHKYNIKVTDFGLSNIYPAGKLLATACGSPSYACPEMLSNKLYDGLKADIWSIGIVLYAMCFGYLPFDNNNVSQLYSLIKKGSFEIPEFASKNLTDLLHKILEVDPSLRLSIKQIRNHPFCKFSIPSNNLITSIPGIIVGLSQIPYQPQIQQQMKLQLNLSVENLKQDINKNRHNQNTCIYYLILQRNLRTKNQSLSQYYLTKYNKINRYVLIEKVKANYDKIQKNKMQVKKFQAVQQQLIRKHGNQSYHHNQKELDSPNTTRKQGHQQNSNKKIIHSAQNQNKRYYLVNETNEDEAYLRSQMKHFAPNNTKMLKPDQVTKRRAKSNSNSKNKNKSKSQRSNSKQQNTKNKNPKKKDNKKSGLKKKNVLQVPRQFYSSPKKFSKNSSNKKSSNKKQSKTSKNKKRSKTLQTQKKLENSKRKQRKQSHPHVSKLNF